MIMRNLESHLKDADYCKSMADMYNHYSPIESDVALYKSIIAMGFMNSFSYYSMVQHERYVFAFEDRRLFMWRNGRGNYYVEFNQEELIDRIAAIKDFPVDQYDNVFEFRFISENILRTFVQEFKK